jgi:cytochrome P450
VDKKVEENIARLRNFLKQLVLDRKSGKTQSIFEEKVDLLSLLLEHPDVFDVESIVDEIIDFFFAASVTTSVNLIITTSHFI